MDGREPGTRSGAGAVGPGPRRGGRRRLRFGRGVVVQPAPGFRTARAVRGSRSSGRRDERSARLTRIRGGLGVTPVRARATRRSHAARAAHWGAIDGDADRAGARARANAGRRGARRARVAPPRCRRPRRRRGRASTSSLTAGADDCSRARGRATDAAPARGRRGATASDGCRTAEPRGRHHHDRGSNARASSAGRRVERPRRWPARDVNRPRRQGARFSRYRAPEQSSTRESGAAPPRVARVVRVRDPESRACPRATDRRGARARERCCPSTRPTCARSASASRTGSVYPWNGRAARTAGRGRARGASRLRRATSSAVEVVAGVERGCAARGGGGRGARTRRPFPFPPGLVARPLVVRLPVEFRLR